MQSRGLLDTRTAFELLDSSLQDLCRDFNGQVFFPLLEADVAAYLYHRLLENGCPLKQLFVETRVCDVPDERRRKYDLVVGNANLEQACVEPVLIAEIKCFQRWGHTPQQHRHRFEGILTGDLRSLQEAAEVLPFGRVEIIVDLVVTSQKTGYLTGTWHGQGRRERLTLECRDRDVSLLWVRSNSKGNLEVERLD